MDHNSNLPTKIMIVGFTVARGESIVGIPASRNAWCTRSAELCSVLGISSGPNALFELQNIESSIESNLKKLDKLSSNLGTSAPKTQALSRAVKTLQGFMQEKDVKSLGEGETPLLKVIEDAELLFGMNHADDNLTIVSRVDNLLTEANGLLLKLTKLERENGISQELGLDTWARLENLAAFLGHVAWQPTLPAMLKALSEVHAFNNLEAKQHDNGFVQVAPRPQADPATMARLQAICSAFGFMFEPQWTAEGAFDQIVHEIGSEDPVLLDKQANAFGKRLDRLQSKVESCTRMIEAFEDAVVGFHSEGSALASRLHTIYQRLGQKSPAGKMLTKLRAANHCIGGIDPKELQSF